MSRKYTNGSGGDSTAATVAHLAATDSPVIYTLVKIQLARWVSDPHTGTASYLTNPILLTDCPAAIAYTPIGTFRTAAVSCGAMAFEIGIEFQGFDVVWNPGPNDVVLASGAGALVPTPPLSIFAAVLAGIFDGAYISVYKVVMPALSNPPTYDANTYGACLLHTGMVQEIQIDGGEIQFRVGSIVDQQDQQIPSQLIGPNSRFASFDPLAYAGSPARNPGSGIYTLLAVIGSTTPSRIVTSWSGSSGFLPPTGYFDGGFVIWADGPLLGMRRAVAHSITSGGNITFQLASRYPYDANLYTAGFSSGFQLDAYSLRNPQTTDPLYDGFPNLPLPLETL
ncbi:MAG: hypothetical protein JWO48_1194 [Bryobacterales bacterium]|nr:hypothetical protein [Bryobacterales bacterium]